MLSLSPGLGPDGLPSPGSGYHHHLAPTSFGSGSGGGSNGASADAVDGAGAIGGASAAGGASELMHQLALRSSTGKEKIHNKISTVDSPNILDKRFFDPHTCWIFFVPPRC